jgi:hypothetical protein
VCPKSDEGGCGDVDDIEHPTLGEVHHYGCECSECIEFYRSLK